MIFQPFEKVASLRSNNYRIHTLYSSKYDLWYCLEEGTAIMFGFSSNKEDSVAEGRFAAYWYRSEHLIHNANGKFAYRNSYGNDPYPPKG